MFNKNQTICILGDALNLSEIEQFEDFGTIKIALNRAFLKQPSQVHFFADRRYVIDQQATFDYSLKAIFPKCFNFPFSEVQTYNPVWTIDFSFQGRLKAGHSVLIPALHYALLSEPKQIILWGVQLNNHQHWYSDAKKEVIFPCKNRVFAEVKQLLEAFKKIKVTSGSRDNFLVTQGLIDVYKK